MKILILGAGAIGGYLGGRLDEAGADVTFLARDARRKQLEAEGLRLRSIYGDIDRPVRVIGPAGLRSEYDLVILTCKAYDLASAIDAVVPGLRADGVVLPILNGLGHMETLNAAFGKDRVLAGTVKISVTRLADGTIRHMNDWRWLRFGEQVGGPSEQVRMVAQAFDGAKGIETVVLDNAMQEMWEKFVHLATAAAATCLMRANVGQIVRTGEGAALFQGLLDTSIEVARHAGYPPSEEFTTSYRSLFADPTSTYATSMLRDIEAGNPAEGEQIVGLLAKKAREAGIRNPVLDAAYAHVKAYEIRRTEGGGI